MSELAKLSHGRPFISTNKEITPKFETFQPDCNSINIKRIGDSISNLKMIIPVKYYLQKIEILANNNNIYTLTNEDIDKLECSVIINNYMYVDFIYLPKFFLKLLPYTEIKVIIHTAPSTYHDIHFYCEYKQEPNINPEKPLFSPIFYNIIKTQISSLNRLVCAESKFAYICLSDLNDIFRLIGLNRIPSDVLQVIHSYLPKDSKYIWLIYLLYYDNINIVYHDRNIELICMNLLVHMSGMLGLRYI